MEERWPTTQQFLLDHLRRIVEGVHRFGNPPDDDWWFGFGDDCLVSRKGPGLEELEGEKDVVTAARIQLFLSLLAIEARDQPSGPTNKKGLQVSYEQLGKIFDNPPNAHEFLRSVLPESADTDTLQQAYAFEMLQKLDLVVDRSKQEAVQTMLFLENVPEAVNSYMAEAAACFRYGFDKACLSVCRSALEESLKRRMIADEHSIKTDRGHYKGLKTLIKEAHENYNYLDDPESADQIRCWGNKAVHGKISKEEFEVQAKKALLATKRTLIHLWKTRSE